MTCPSNPAAPSGTSVWQGAVPAPLSAWAVKLLKTVNKYPYGTTWQMQYGGQTVTARKDYHTWHFQPDGTLLTGICWPGITLYRPLPTGQGFVEESPTATTGDPIATPSEDIAGALVDAPPATTDWSLVALSGIAIIAVVGGFWWAIRAKPR